MGPGWGGHVGTLADTRPEDICERSDSQCQTPLTSPQQLQTLRTDCARVSDVAECFSGTLPKQWHFGSAACCTVYTYTPTHHASVNGCVLSVHKLYPDKRSAQGLFSRRVFFIRRDVVKCATVQTEKWEILDTPCHSGECGCLHKELDWVGIFNIFGHFGWFQKAVFLLVSAILAVFRKS